jgi:hypothetical protein
MVALSTLLGFDSFGVESSVSVSWCQCYKIAFLSVTCQNKLECLPVAIFKDSPTFTKTDRQTDIPADRQIDR